MTDDRFCYLRSPGHSPRNTLRCNPLRPLPTGHESAVPCHTDTQKPRFR